LQETSQYLQKLQNRIKPALRQDIQKELMIVGKLLNIPIEKYPDNEAFEGWITILEEYPIDLIKMASKNILKTHKYQNFPLIAEFTLFMDDLLKERKKAIHEEKRFLKDQKFIKSL
tara:strand:- start:309 stop:656 length:348 start_codon:yes stop_codon:yes gene_type:complete